MATSFPLADRAGVPHAGAFSNVDDSHSPHSLVSYLDRANTDPQVQHVKTQVIERLLRPKRGERLLDVGCGVGHDTLKLATLVGSSGRVVGLDQSATMIREARRRASHLRPRLQFCAGDAHRLEWANNTFDGCLVMSTFMHIQSPKQALREMVRVLKRGGRLVALEPDWDTLVMTVGDATVSSIIVNAVRQSVRHSGIAHELPVLFRQAGLQPVKVEAGTTVVSEYRLASDVWRIAESLNHACQSEIRGSYKTRGLLLQLNRASKKAEFFAASTGFAVCGRKP